MNTGTRILTLEEPARTTADYTFERFTQIRNKMPTRSSIRVRKTAVSMNKLAYERMGRPERIGIEYDEKHEVVRLFSDEHGWKVGRPSPYIVCKLSRIMPEGMYMEKEPGIFVREKRIG
jgi:hypothetical protein